MARWLQNLNSAQHCAVTHPPTSLQILARPGSGKTRVLTCRVAYLIEEMKLDPADLVVMTFTNKAANEMKHRLQSLIGSEYTSHLNIGTFHSMAVIYLRKFGRHINLKPNWVIADRDQQLAYAKALLKDPSNEAILHEQIGTIKPNLIIEHISKMKAKGMSPTDALKDPKASSLSKTLAHLYQAYEEKLLQDNALDFDDLLVKAEILFTKYPKSIQNIRHVLIDEFQDTNTIQFNIMLKLAHRQAATVVGDPDQGIYGWRNAEITNLANMSQSFEDTNQILLEENYRSSPAILKASLAVVEQDRKRIAKVLFTSHPETVIPTLRPFSNVQDESRYIAQEIQRMIAHTGGLLSYSDFAILLRFSALSRAIEQSLTAAGIPSRMAGGHKFFNRVEVKDVLAYLQLADNPSFNPAFDRVVNVPKRNVGPAALKEIESSAKARKISMFEACEQMVKGKLTIKLNGAQKTRLKSFVEVINTIRRMNMQQESVATMIDTLCETIEYQAHLMRTPGPESELRWMNVQELKSFSIQGTDGGQEEIEASSPIPTQDDPTGNISIARGSFGPDDVAEDETSKLRDFLATCMLSTDVDTERETDAEKKNKVTISTCHAAKGLEWPVVFLPAVEDGVIPLYRAQQPAEVDEERRLLFVAMTRAQVILYLTYSDFRMLGAETKKRTISPFVAKLPLSESGIVTPKHIFQQRSPILNQSTRSALCRILARQKVSEADVKLKLSAYVEPPGVPLPGAGVSTGARSAGASKWSYRNPDGMPNHDPQAKPYFGSYASQPTSISTSNTETNEPDTGPNSITGRGSQQAGFASALALHKQPSADYSLELGLPSFGEVRSSKIAPAINGKQVVNHYNNNAVIPNLGMFQNSSQQFLNGIKDNLPALSEESDSRFGLGACSTSRSGNADTHSKSKPGLKRVETNQRTAAIESPALGLKGGRTIEKRKSDESNETAASTEGARKRRLGTGRPRVPRPN